MSTPIVPPRPQRTQAGATTAKNDTPVVPPRPARKTDPSPDREQYTRSPLNGPPVSFAGNRRASQETSRSSLDLPRRPPSVSLPSIGQEGAEYSSYDQPIDDTPSTETLSPDGELRKTVSADLPIHQPRASVSKAAAKRQIETVTRTDSTQAAAAGIGKARPADDVHNALPTEPGLTRVTSRTHELQPLRSKTSFNRSTSSLQPLERSTSRASSIHGGPDYEHGIPEIGQQVPLLAYAGDVQAPSPAPLQSQFAPGIGFFNDGSPRNHHRKRSSRQEFFPPDTYGLRHDQDHQDQFEKAWIAKHPQEAAKEEFYMHLPRPETALSSEQLNKLVHQAQLSSGTRDVIGTPDEDFAFNASEEYIRKSSPQPALLRDRVKRPSSGSQPAMESPLRRTSFPQHDGRRDQAMESEDEQSYHLQPPARRTHKVTGGGDADPKLDIGAHGEDAGYASDAYHPILAADELIKRPGSAYMHAAIEPGVDRTADEYYDSDHAQWPSSGRRGSANPPSRPSSRPGSVHGGVAGYSGGALHRFTSHEEQHHSGLGTPLEEIEEYEPLFPDDETEGPKKVFKKRPDLAHHHFPSQDIWEDTPASLQYSATVSTPDLERAALKAGIETGDSAAAFETPEQEQKRRDANPADMTSSSKTFVKPQFKAGVRDEMHGRPGVQRFPSSDVWEDSPDTFNLTTTVSGPQLDELKSAQDEAPVRPLIPARPEKPSKLSQELKPGEDASSPAKPKPSVPARPTRSTQAERGEDAAASAPAAKAKPAVPARPAGSKIAALQAGFMNDLNNRLKVGPQAPPTKKELEPEAAEETEKAPLADARKGRARGPARRKPGVASTTEMKSSTFAFSPLITVWTIDEEDELTVQPETKKREPTPSTEEMNDIMAANESENIKEPTFSPPPADGEDESRPAEATGFDGDEPETRLSAAAVDEQKATQPGLEAALAEAEPAPSSHEDRLAHDDAAAGDKAASLSAAQAERDGTSVSEHTGDVIGHQAADNSEVASQEVS